MILISQEIIFMKITLKIVILREVDYFKMQQVGSCLFLMKRRKLVKFKENELSKI